MRRIFLVLGILLLTILSGVATFFILERNAATTPRARYPEAKLLERIADTMPTTTDPTPAVSVPVGYAQTAEIPTAIPAKFPVTGESTPGPLLLPPPTKTLVVPAQPQPPSPPPTPTTPGTAPSQVGALNQYGILTLSNNERIKAGLPPLTFSTKLSVMAEGKVIDMITKQYFAHDSPDGTTISMLAKKYGYAYLFVGENLALGDFDSSADVVTGWMNSPGHRANILGKDFTEIGISALRGNYEGHEVWYAVQEFGKPMPVCADPDTIAKQKIAIYEAQLPLIEEEINQTEIALRDRSNRAAYNAKVKEYQALVELYNSTVQSLKSEIVVYNASVEIYNSCISG